MWWRRLMRIVSILLVVFVAVLLSGQSNSSKYQPALILGVTEHQGPIPENIREKIKEESTAHYDVSIRLKGNNAEYVLLYTPPPRQVRISVYQGHGPSRFGRKRYCYDE